MSVPQSSSRFFTLLFTSNHTAFPVNDWLCQASNEKEIMEILLSVQGIPHGWLESIEKEIQRLEKRGHIIKNRNRYALSTLWSGITLLQECKFLCDVLENALRSSFINFVLFNQITYLQLYPSTYFRNETRIPKKLLNFESSIITPSFVLEIGFGALVKTMELNWNYIKIDKNKRVWGFRRIFWDIKHCRDVNLFKRDILDGIVKVRNEVAHSKKLFTRDELLDIKDKVCKWLAPLNVELMQKVQKYRINRPKFLQDLEI